MQKRAPTVKKSVPLISIYSLGAKNMCRLMWDLTPGPSDEKRDALATEVIGQITLFI